jgi:hypothetical protein
MNINCINDKIANSKTALKPIILQAILDLFKEGKQVMSLKMVRQRCILLDSKFPRTSHQAALATSMRNAIKCGGRIVGENRDSNDFTIAFDSNGNNLEIKIPKKTNPKVDSKPKDKSNSSSITNYTNQIEIEKLNLSKNFKVVMICAGGKHNSFFKAYPKENFVNKPELSNEHHPDDKMNDKKTSWRDYLINNQNDNNLLEAYNLYTREEYRCLHRKYEHNFYILSAGWGLVNSEFKLPKYDITFSNTANLRTKRNDNLIGAPLYNDFNLLNLDGKEDIVYIGSPDYIPLFFDLTSILKNRKIIYWKGMAPMPVPVRFPIPNNTFLYRYYNTNTRMNWYYEVARDFCNGIIP